MWTIFDTTHLVVAHESRKSWRALGVENLDELCAEVGIHGRQERTRLYAVLNHGRHENNGLDALASS